MPTAPEHEALRLADRVEAMAQALPAYGFVTTPLVEAAAELRRLHALTQTGGWQDIASAPEGELVLVGWVDVEDSIDRQDFDMLEEGVWLAHEESREHFLMVAPPGSRGPKETAPYTHWRRIGPLPAPSSPSPSPSPETGEAAEQAKNHRPLKRCASDNDGDCRHQSCPQLRDHEPHKSGRSCPLYDWSDDARF